MKSTWRSFKTDVMFEVMVMSYDKIGQIWVIVYDELRLIVQNYSFFAVDKCSKIVDNYLLFVV